MKSDEPVPYKGDPQESGPIVLVHKLDSNGAEVLRYPGNVLRSTDTSITLVAFFDREEKTFSGLHLQPGDRFIETFFSDRWYNVFRIHAAHDGRLKGWYCNITRPARIELGHVFADDLALDLVVLPDGKHRVLDEAEFAALPLSDEERRNALQALEELKTFAFSRSGPFQSPP